MILPFSAQVSHFLGTTFAVSRHFRWILKHPSAARFHEPSRSSYPVSIFNLPTRAPSRTSKSSRLSSFRRKLRISTRRGSIKMPLESPSKVELQTVAPSVILEPLCDLGTPLPLPLLHSQLCHRRLESIVLESTLLGALTTRLGSKIATEIHAHARAICSDTSKISAVHCSVLYPIHGDDIGWPVLQWRMDNGLEALTLFHASHWGNDTASWSSLTHYGMRDCQHDMGWSRSALAWNVTSMEALDSLFQVAQHGSGILSLPEAAARKIYCPPGPQAIETHEYCPVLHTSVTNRIAQYWRLLFEHFRKIAVTKMHFARAAPLLKELTSREGTQQLPRLTYESAWGCT
jgi:hypothetical protein